MFNQLINIFWTIIAFSVTGHYWGRYFTEKHSLWLVYIYIVISMFAYNIPARWVSFLTLSNNRRIYEMIGIRAMRWLVQDGMYVSRVNRRLGKKHRRISGTGSARAYLTTIAVQERFHYSCFVFFALSTASALRSGQVHLAISIMLCNIVYNVFPILLQQYNRLRIKNLLYQAADIPDLLKPATKRRIRMDFRNQCNFHRS